jgi:ketosteroid isomerase-like protein
MTSNLESSAEDFTRLWCSLFVGDTPDVARAIECFDEEATILVPGLSYRIGRDEDAEEINFSHLVDGRGHIHFWQVIEPRVQIIGDAAVVSYYARYNIGRAGESATRQAKETLVLTRQADDWKIVHLHNSLAS